MSWYEIGTEIGTTHRNASRQNEGSNFSPGVEAQDSRVAPSQSSGDARAS